MATTNKAEPRPNPMNYKCIIFDCDGVLVDSEAITAKVLVEMAHELGLSLNETFVLDYFMGKSFNDIMRYLEEKLHAPLPASFENAFRSRTFAAFTTSLRPIPGIPALLEQLTIPFCVASSGPMEKIRHNLTLTGLIDKFEGRIFSCYEIQRWKPLPDIYWHAAERMGFAIADCVVIEDSDPGITAALSGGFDVFAYARHRPAENVLPKGAVAFHDMQQLKSLLSQRAQ